MSHREDNNRWLYQTYLEYKEVDCIGHSFPCVVSSLLVRLTLAILGTRPVGAFSFLLSIRVSHPALDLASYWFKRSVPSQRIICLFFYIIPEHSTFSFFRIITFHNRFNHIDYIPTRRRLANRIWFESWYWIGQIAISRNIPSGLHFIQRMIFVGIRIWTRTTPIVNCTGTK